MSELYNRIAALCEDRGITVTELCRQCKISACHSPIGNTDQKQCIPKNLSKISNYFDALADFYF